MSAYSQIESWISQTTLASDGMNKDADGFWRLPYGRITLSLGVPEQADSFLLYTPLMSVTGAGDATLAAFYQYLLHLQLQGALPAGMAFGMELEDTLVGMVGQYELKGMDLPAFDTLLRNVASAADGLCAQLQNHFISLMDADAPATMQEKSPQSPSARVQLSDEELLLANMMQSIRL